MTGKRATMRKAALYAASGGLLTLAFGALGAQEAEAAPKSKPHGTSRPAAAKPKPNAKPKPAPRKAAPKKAAPKKAVPKKAVPKKAGPKKAVAPKKAPAKATKPAAKPKPRPVAKPKPAPKPRAVPKPAPKPRAVPKPAPKPKAVPKPKLAPTPRPAPKPKAGPKAKAAPTPRLAPKPKAVPKPAPGAKPRPAPRPKMVPKPPAPPPRTAHKPPNTAALPTGGPRDEAVRRRTLKTNPKPLAAQRPQPPANPKTRTPQKLPNTTALPTGGPRDEAMRRRALKTTPKPPAAQQVPPPPTHPKPRAMPQSLRLAEAAAQKESQTAREYAKRREAMEELVRTAPARQAYAEAQRGGAPGTAARRAERDLQLRIAQGQVDYHDAIMGKKVGERDAQVVEKVDDKRTRVTNARTGQSAVLDMPLSGYLHPTSKSVEADMNTVVNGEPTKVRQTVKVDEWRKPKDPRYANMSVGATADGRTVTVSPGNLPKEVKERLRDSRMLGPEEGKATGDGRTVTVFQPKQRIEHNAEDLGKQWKESVKDGKVRPGELGQALAGTAAIGTDFFVGMGQSNVYGTGKDCLGGGKNCGDFATEAGLAAVSATPLKGAGLARNAVSGAARGGSAVARAEQAAEKAARVGRSSSPRPREAAGTPTRATAEAPRPPVRETAEAPRVPALVGAPARASVATPRPPTRPTVETPRPTVETPRPTVGSPRPTVGTPRPPVREAPQASRPSGGHRPVVRRAPEIAALGIAGATQLPGQPEAPRAPGATPDGEPPTTREGEPRFVDPANPDTLADPEGPEAPRQPPATGDSPIIPEHPTGPDRPGTSHDSADGQPDPEAQPTLDEVIPDGALDKIPDHWPPPTDTRKEGEGIRFFGPNRNREGVRIDNAVPNSPYPSQRVPHVVVRDGGRVIGRDGKPISGSIKDDYWNAHIPLSEWITWSQWNKP